MQLLVYYAVVNGVHVILMLAGRMLAVAMTGAAMVNGVVEVFTLASFDQVPQPA